MNCVRQKSALEQVDFILYTSQPIHYAGDVVHAYCLPDGQGDEDFTFAWYVNGILQEEARQRDLVFQTPQAEVGQIEVRVILRHKREKQKEAVLNLEIRPIAVRELYLASSTALRKLDNYLSTNSGPPPNATRSVSIEGQSAVALYHVFEDDPVHLRNGGATTSESQVLFYNYLSLYALAEGSTLAPEAAYRYLRYFMMPHDGLSSLQLPDSRLIALPQMERLIHWLVQIEPCATSGRPVAGDRIFPQPHTPYKIYDVGFQFTSTPAIAQGEDGLPDLTRTWPQKDGNTYIFSASLDADQWIISGYLFSLFGGKDYWEDIRLSKRSLLDCLIDFIKIAQDAYWVNYNVVGPFMPTYNLANRHMSWIGPDLNTHLMLFQYRIFRNLCMYYFLSGDNRAGEIINLFHAFIENHARQEGENILLPFALNSGINDSWGLLLFRMSQEGQLRDFPYFVKNELQSKLKRIWNELPVPTDTREPEQAYTALALFGKKEFHLDNGQFFAYKGALVNINNTENTLTFTWYGNGWQGAEH